MNRFATFHCLLLVASIGLATPGRAGEPRPGPWYENPTLGFKLKVPKDWESVQGQPNDKNLILKYDPPTNKIEQLGGGAYFDPHVWIVQFDRREQVDAALDKGEKPRFEQNHKDLPTWVAKGEPGPGYKALGQVETRTINKLEVKEYRFTSNKISRNGEKPVNLYAAVFALQPKLDVAVVFNGPGDDRKWNQWERAASGIAKSMRAIEADAPSEALAEGASMRDRRRAELEEQLRQAPEWKLYETPHYFIISNNDDKAFLDELQGRLEAIHAIYEQDYPPEVAKELREIGASTKTGPEKPAGTAPEKEGADEPEVDPMERAKCSVVRVVKDQEQYYSYGGPQGSAGYWAAMHEELVLFDDQKGGGRRDTWAVLNHEAFHQYIFYFYGNIAPQSWYNEGTGDFYSGYEYKHKRFTLKKFDWRVPVITEAIREGNYVPLKDFVRMTQQEYYSSQPKYGREGTNIGIHYAQGWSFIYFLRTGKKANAKGWNDRWDTILETYLRTLAMSGKVDLAVDEAFRDVDFDALEQAWLEYTR